MTEQIIEVDILSKHQQDVITASSDSSITAENKTTEVSKMRHFLLFITASMAAFIMWTFWTQYDLVYKQKKDIEILTSTLQQIESTIDVKIKARVEETINLSRNNEIRKLVGNATKNRLILDYFNVSSSTEFGLSKPKYFDIKTVLIWTSRNNPIKFLLKDNEAFVERKCYVQNCYILSDESYVDVTEIDVILFNGKDVLPNKHFKLPPKRYPRQKYVFASIESSGFYPICDNRFDGYFNISWTYKLDSDIFYGYVIIRDRDGYVVGPRRDMHWMHIDDMKPINKSVKERLGSKTKLAAWFVSNCDAPNNRHIFVKDLQVELKKLGSDMTVDVYGTCGPMSCPMERMADCLQKIEKDYYFYLVFENSFAEDYVTEKLLHALQHYAVPVVYGTANYTRFMPDGIYLDALKLGPEKLAIRMLTIANDIKQYYNFFKWMNHYSFHKPEEASETDVYCKFCEAINDGYLLSKTTAIDDFKKWWNPREIRTGACA